MGVPLFIGQVAGDPAEAARLASLGAETPEALLGIISASRDVFDRWVGPAEAQRIVQRLQRMVPPDSPSLAASNYPPGTLGVLLTPGPVAPLTPAFDIDVRDALFRRLEQLRQSGAPVDEVRKAEQDLDSLLRGSVTSAHG